MFRLVEKPDDAAVLLKHAPLFKDSVFDFFLLHAKKHPQIADLVLPYVSAEDVGLYAAMENLGTTNCIKRPVEKWIVNTILNIVTIDDLDWVVPELLLLFGSSRELYANFSANIHANMAANVLVSAMQHTAVPVFTNRMAEWLTLGQFIAVLQLLPPEYWERPQLYDHIEGDCAKMVALVTFYWIRGRIDVVAADLHMFLGGRDIPHGVDFFANSRLCDLSDHVKGAIIHQLIMIPGTIGHYIEEHLAMSNPKWLRLLAEYLQHTPQTCSLYRHHRLKRNIVVLNFR